MTHVLADLDGTLIDSFASVRRAWRAWARRHGVDVAELEATMHGRPSADVIAEFAPQLEPARESAAIDLLQARDSADVVALPGAAELLEDGDRFAGVAIVTSCTEELLTARMAAAGLRRPAVVVTPERVRAGKPDPEGYLLAAAELGADPAGCTVLEDAPAGVEAGRRAGMHVIAVLTTHSAGELAAADELVADVATWLSACA
jgi:mannitol-1-/sugar-/sorbitol-6-phosphatase